MATLEANNNDNPNGMWYVLFFGLGILFMFMFRDCGNKKPRTEKYIDYKEKYTVVEHVDTVKPKNNVVTHHVYKTHIKDSVRITNINTYCDYQRNYIDTISDDKVDIYVNDSITGILLAQNISYKLKVPLEITKTITITDSVFVTTEKNQRGHRLNNFRVFVAGTIAGFAGAMVAYIALTN